ncbi:MULTISPECIES: hypothetical protein [Lysinibacillus]|nr:hypothetical protein [Lysinibacillus sphaericus]
MGNIGRPRKLCSVRKRSDSNKAPQSERKSITRYGDEPVLVYF